MTIPCRARASNTPVSIGQVSLAIILIHILPFGATNFLCTLIPSGFSRDAPEDATARRARFRPRQHEPAVRPILLRNECNERPFSLGVHNRT